MDQLIDLGFEPSSPPTSTGAWDWVTEAEKDRRKALVVAIEALDLLLNLPDIPLLISPPGDKAALKHRTRGRVRAAHHGVDDPYAEAKTLSI